MKTLAKTVNLKAVPGTTEESVIEKLLKVKEEGRGQQMRYMSKWIQGGYLLGELGHGLLESLIAMDGARLMDGMSEMEKAKFLVNLIERTAWRETRPEPAPVPAPAPVRTESKPEAATGQATDIPAEAGQAKPTQRKRRRINTNVA